MDSLPYNTLFPVSTDSAERIVPLLLSLLGPCERVLDLGGGVGAWCREFRKHGSRVTCIDGQHIRDEELVIDRTEFMAVDLAASMPAPIEADLALSLEFAEHVPAERGPDIVRFLTRSSPIVVFSASMPGQPGHRHVNERPALYWKELFAGMGFACLDLIRPRIIGRADIPYWYRQNMFVYASQQAAARLQPLAAGFATIPDDFELVHQSVLKRYRAALEPPGMRRWLSVLPQAVRASWRSVSRRPEQRCRSLLRQI